MYNILYYMFVILLSSIGCVLLYSDRRAKKHCTVAIKATIVDVVKRREKQSGSDSCAHYVTVYYPIIEYYVAGRLLRITSSVGSSSHNKYSVGNLINIRYNPRTPEKFIVENDNTQFIVGIVFVFGGLVILLGGIALLPLFNVAGG